MGWVDAVLAGVSSYFSSRSDDRREEARSEDDYKWGARLSSFNRADEYYYDQLKKDEMRRGASEYGKFSSLDRWAPNYRQTFQPNPVPTKPEPMDYEDEDDDD